jgi:hypothetical protein
MFNARRLLIGSYRLNINVDYKCKLNYLIFGCPARFWAGLWVNLRQ